ncbi:hypothetical protein HK104_010996 [Borealophlyctis nickersoniae]|nr:hypothetical protein HK104_010996 [Borealophlyctis nickersoniae]
MVDGDARSADEDKLIRMFCVANPASVVVGDQIYFFGGACDDEELGQMINCCLLRYDVPNRLLHVVSSNEGPGPRLGASLTYIPATETTEPCLLLFGGLIYKHDPLQDCFIYNLATGEWSEPTFKGEPPSHRESHSAVFWAGPDGRGRKVVVYGGMNVSALASKGRGRLDDVVMLDLDTSTWVHPVVKDSPKGRSLHTAHVVGSKMVVYGGWVAKEGELENEGDLEKLRRQARLLYTPSPDVLVFDIEKMVWEPASTIPTGSLPEPRANHSASMIGNMIYIYGGRLPHTDSVLFNHAKDMWRLQVGAPMPPGPVFVESVKSAVEDEAKFKITWKDECGWVEDRRYRLTVRRAHERTGPWALVYEGREQKAEVGELTWPGGQREKLHPEESYLARVLAVDDTGDSSFWDDADENVSSPDYAMLPQRTWKHFNSSDGSGEKLTSTFTERPAAPSNVSATYLRWTPGDVRPGGERSPMAAPEEDKELLDVPSIRITWKRSRRETASFKVEGSCRISAAATKPTQEERVIKRRRRGDAFADHARSAEPATAWIRDDIPPKPMANGMASPNDIPNQQDVESSWQAVWEGAERELILQVSELHRMLGGPTFNGRAARDPDFEASVGQKRGRGPEGDAPLQVEYQFRVRTVEDWGKSKWSLPSKSVSVPASLEELGVDGAALDASPESAAEHLAQEDARTRRPAARDGFAAPYPIQKPQTPRSVSPMVVPTVEESRETSPMAIDETEPPAASLTPEQPTVLADCTASQKPLPPEPGRAAIPTAERQLESHMPVNENPAPETLSESSTLQKPTPVERATPVAEVVHDSPTPSPPQLGQTRLMGLVDYPSSPEEDEESSPTSKPLEPVRGEQDREPSLPWADDLVENGSEAGAREEEREESQEQIENTGGAPEGEIRPTDVAIQEPSEQKQLEEASPDIDVVGNDDDEGDMEKAADAKTAGPTESQVVSPAADDGMEWEEEEEEVSETEIMGGTVLPRLGPTVNAGTVAQLTASPTPEPAQEIAASSKASPSKKTKTPKASPTKSRTASKTKAKTPKERPLSDSEIPKETPKRRQSSTSAASAAKTAKTPSRRTSAQSHTPQSTIGYTSSLRAVRHPTRFGETEEEIDVQGFTPPSASRRPRHRNTRDHDEDSSAFDSPLTTADVSEDSDEEILPVRKKPTKAQKPKIPVEEVAPEEQLEIPLDPLEVKAIDKNGRPVLGDPSNSFHFSLKYGDRVEVKWGPVWYSARVLCYAAVEKGWDLRIHYEGWRKEDDAKIGLNEEEGYRVRRYTNVAPTGSAKQLALEIWDASDPGAYFLKGKPALKQAILQGKYAYSEGSRNYCAYEEESGVGGSGTSG